MKTVEVNEIIDNARFTPFHWMVMWLCALLLIFDGYDLFIYGVVLPELMKEWGLTPVQAGALGSYALFGMMFGAFIFGPLADRIGRKKGIAICFVLFSGSTFLNGFAQSPTEFGIYRFIAGLGCGGLMPNAVALMNEGAKSVSAYVTHGVLSGGAVGRVTSSPLKELVITDSIQATEAVRLADNIRQLSIAPLIAEAIKRISQEASVSSLFE